MIDDRKPDGSVIIVAVPDLVQLAHRERRQGPSDRRAVIQKSGALRRYPCGHDGWDAFSFDLYEEEYLVTAEFVAAYGKCPACLLAMVLGGHIRCAECGHVILAGDPVTLYRNDGAFRAEWAFFVGEDKEGVIGCLRDGCRSNITFIEGRWNGRAFQGAGGGRTSVTRTQRPLNVIGVDRFARL